MLNFGAIKEKLNDILIEGILTKNPAKKVIYQKFTKKLKQNKVLREQFMVYRNLETVIESEKSKIDLYVSENISVLKKFGIETIKRENKKLLSELNVKISDDFDYNRKNLHEEICKLLVLNKTAKNINKIVESVNTISLYIGENKPKKVLSENLIPSTLLANVSVEKFNERYSDLSETEKKTVKLMVGGTDLEKEDLLKNSINECVTLIDKNYDGSSIAVKEKLLKVKSKLLNTKYTNENFINDISTVMELTKTLIPSTDNE